MRLLGGAQTLQASSNLGGTLSFKRLPAHCSSGNTTPRRLVVPPSQLRRAIPHLFARERHVMRPFALEITAGDFAFAGYHRASCRDLVCGGGLSMVRPLRLPL
jgi:hypothetical protein